MTTAIGIIKNVVLVFFATIGFCGILYQGYVLYEQHQAVWAWTNDANCRVFPERCNRQVPQQSPPVSPTATPKGK